MKELYKIPLSNIDRIEVFVNDEHLSLSDIVKRKAPDLAIEGTFYEYSWKAACHLKADGKILSNDTGYSTKGYAWDTGPDLALAPLGKGITSSKKNYLTCCFLGENGIPSNPLYYNADVGGARGRGAIGTTEKELFFYACTDGVDSLTPEQLRGKMFSSGVRDAIMLDGGGKVNYYNRATGTMMQGKEKSQNLLLVYLKKAEKPTPKKPIVCLDPGHGPDTENGSPDGTYLEQEFCFDLAQRIKKHLERNSVGTVLTRKQSEHPSMEARCKVSNDANADVCLSIHSDAAGNAGYSSARGLHCFTSAGPETAPRNVMARAILKEMVAAGVTLFQNIPRYRDDLAILNGTKAPATLIEYGFHTNKEDIALLKTVAYREKLAEATAKGLCTYLGVTYTPAAQPVPEPVVDPENVPDTWAKPAWDKATAKKLFDGTRPRAAVTRQELAEIMNRLGLL